MPFSIYVIAEAAIIAASLSLDAFTAGFAYGSKKIKIPLSSIMLVSIICSAATGLSFFAGSVLAPFIPKRITLLAAFSILFVIGTIKLLDSITKNIIRRHSNINKQFKLSLFNFKLILSLYANPEDADVDFSKTISPAEAAIVAVSLSLDGMAIGFGAAFVNVNGLAVFVLSLISNVAAIICGYYSGSKIADKLTFNISWVSGAVLIILAFSKLM